MRLKEFLVLISLFLWPIASVQAEVLQASNHQLQALLESGVPLVDVRTQSEWQQTGIIEGSHLLTFWDEKGDYDAAQWLAELMKVAGREQPVALICATGGRTAVIADFMDKQLGYIKVYNVTYGIVPWLQEGRNVVTVPPSN